ncbi:hypothetical protein H2202_007673 [Exophiala xenobiotica]|nr:hypothetical protein H2202_007673 [Exophiala xenobiotica]KAK5236317.1 hypothetical protein LTR47_002268 [Exophiala xenobiotica]KAK5248841.1 hypothetical protein LTS06_006140 [Exophiala xenobiotica]KAK5323094.1 hypothetical protein LTR93_005147 [Exophiala xenobiotica]KAK5350429.1 hypothetical protein LTR61_005626 [Exophiala xenobiotica]
MEVVGGVSAILTLTAEFQHICKKLKRFIKNVKHAHTEVRLIVNETEIYANLLQRFDDTVRKADSQDAGFIGDVDSSHVTDCIVRASAASLQKIKCLLKKSEPLRADKKNYSQFQKLLARLKWSGWKEEWLEIQLCLNSTKQIATLVLVMVYFEKLVKEVNTLKAQNRDVPELLLKKLDLSRREIKSLRVDVKKLQRQCERLELKSEERPIVQFNMVLAETTRGVVRTYIDHHEEIKAMLNPDTPPASNVATNSWSNRSRNNSQSGSSERWNLSTTNASLGIDALDSEFGDDEEIVEVVEEESNANDLCGTMEEEYDHIEEPVEEPVEEPAEEPVEGIAEEAFEELIEEPAERAVSEAEEGPAEELIEELVEGAIEPRLALPAEVIDDDHGHVEETAFETEDTDSCSSFLDLTYSTDAPKKTSPSEQWMQAAQYGLRGVRLRRHKLGSRTPDLPPQDIIVDRDDGRGPCNEYRPPRKPRNPPA